MSFNAEKLYNLLPAIYRIRDTEQGEPLKALLSVISEQIEVLEEDLAQLYDNQFIETCAEWVVPYIGDLIGYRTLHGVAPQISSPRAEVANTIGYRRRKGTAAMLEQLARDVTGWDANVVEFFQLLATTQYMNHLRPSNYYAPNLRNWKPLEPWSNSPFDSLAHTQGINSPFDSLAHTVDVRRIASERGRYNIPNVGIFLWRLQSYFVTHSTACAISEAEGRYTFNSLGINAPLFNRPQPETEITQMAEEINVSKPLGRRDLYEELEARRQALVDVVEPLKVYFADEHQVFQVFLDDQSNPVPPEEILICDLTDWQRPPTSKQYKPKPTPKNINPQEQTRTIQVAVDPILGRIVFPDDNTPKKVEVSYAYGFSSDMGGGPYDRSESVSQVLRRFRKVTWQMGVTQNAPDNDNLLVKTLAEAVTAWNQQQSGTVGVICIMDSRTYRTADLSTIQIPAGSQLLIVAADWSTEKDRTGSSGQKQHILGQLEPKSLRPYLLGNLSVQGTPAPSSSDDSDAGQLVLNGLLIKGVLTVLDGNLGSLEIAHCTLVPLGHNGLTVEPSNPQLSVSINHSICGFINLADTVPKLLIADSIVNSDEGGAIWAPDTATILKTSTIMHSSTVRSIEASNSIFTAQVIAKQRQIGCMRFSYLPLNSQVPRRYRCQPETKGDVTGIFRQFTSLDFAHPAYCQLSQRCPMDIRQGADDEAEMGAFHDLYQPQRETNLRVRLDEYLRFGLEAGIFYAT